MRIIYYIINFFFLAFNLLRAGAWLTVSYQQLNHISAFLQLLTISVIMIIPALLLIAYYVLHDTVPRKYHWIGIAGGAVSSIFVHLYVLAVW
jgi:hypothetical protein